MPAHAQDDVLRLTLEQKIGQMFMVGLWGEVPTDLGRDLVTQYQPGGMVVFEYNVGTPDSVTALVNTYQQTIIDAGGLPMFVGVDQEGGRVQTFEAENGFTAFPIPQLVAASGDPALVEQYGTALATEVSAVGVNMNFAPVLDLEINLNNPTLYRRMLGSDPYIVGEVGVGIINGLQGAGVMAIAKHFPGHGATDEDSHNTLPIIDADRTTLDERELIPFRAAIEADVAGIMVSHIWFPALESQPNTPASLSYSVVTRLLREDLGYQGLILTDALDMDAIDTNYPAGAAAVQAVLAGVDVLVLGPHMPLSDQQAAMQAVVEAVRSGAIPESRIDESVQRILEAKARYGVLDWQPLEVEGAAERIDADAHAELVDQLFRAGITVAFNENDLLPIASDEPTLMIFPGNRSSIQRDCDRFEFEQMRWASVNPSPDEAEIAALAQTAERVASQGGTVVVFVENAYQDPPQAALVNALPLERTVAISLFSPYDWLRFPDVGAFMTTYSPLSAAIPPTCEIIFGETAARGQLPVTLTAP